MLDTCDKSFKMTAVYRVSFQSGFSKFFNPELTRRYRNERNEKYVLCTYVKFLFVSIKYLADVLFISKNDLLRIVS